MVNLSDIIHSQKFKLSLTLLLVGAVLLTTGLLISGRQIFQQNATSADDEIGLLTQNIIQKQNLIKASVGKPIVGDAAFMDQQVGTMVAVATRRKMLMEEEALRNPTDFLGHATLAGMRDSLPPEVQPYIEQSSTIRGTIQSGIHNDDFVHKESIYSMAVVADNKKYSVVLTQPPGTITSPQTTISGITLGNTMVSDNAQKTAFQTQAGPLDASGVVVPGSVNIAVIGVKFQNTSYKDVDLTKMRGIILDDPNSVKNYYAQASFGHLPITADFFGTYTLPINLPTSDCPGPFDMSEWGPMIDDLAASNGAQISQYTHKMYVLTGGFANCHAEAGAGVSVAGVVRNTSWYYYPVTNPYDYIHELGHNLGLYHANLLQCTNAQISNYDAPVGPCSTAQHIAPFGIEYGDNYDPMGSYGITTYFSTPHLIQLGWLTSTHVQDVSTSGIYSINPIETSGQPGITAIRIPKSNTNEQYYLDYRQPIGFDQTLASNAYNGIQVRIGPVFNSEPPVPLSRILDMTPNSPGSPDETLFDTGIFTDSENAIQVTQLCHDTNHVVVKVEFGGATISSNTPLCAGITPILPTPTVFVPTKPPLPSATKTEPTITPIPTQATTSCSPRPNIVRSVTADNNTKTVTVTATAGTNESTPQNTLNSIRFTTISNATVQIAGHTLTNASTPEEKNIILPTNTTSITFTETRTPGVCAAVTVSYIWSDACGNFPDFSGAGTSALTCN